MGQVSFLILPVGKYDTVLLIAAADCFVAPTPYVTESRKVASSVFYNKGYTMVTKTEEVKVLTRAEGRIVEVSVHGKLTQQDCEQIIPVIDAGVEQHGQVRLMFDCVGFEGWTFGGLLEESRFGLHHYNAIFRLAIVGDKTWEKVLATLCKPFTGAVVMYYDISEIETARAWLREGT